VRAASLPRGRKLRRPLPTTRPPVSLEAELALDYFELRSATLRNNFSTMTVKAYTDECAAHR